MTIDGRRVQRTQWTKLAAVVIATTALSAPGARAAEFHFADGDVAGLIAAIHAANATDEADTINLAAGGMYTLRLVDNELLGPSGLPVVLRPLTINGNGSTVQRALAVSTPAFRVLANISNLGLRALTIRNGSVPADGGGIWNNGMLELTDVIIEGNRAQFGGGGLFNVDPGTVELVRCQIVNNEASQGGGVRSDNGLEATESDFSGNEASSSGGGIQISGSVRISRCVLTDNVTEGDGGAIRGGRGLIVGSTVTGNAAMGNGGGIVVGGELLVQECTIDHNSAGNDGGGLWMRVGGLGGLGSLQISNSTVSGNDAIRNGGGVCLIRDGASAMATATIENSTLHGNRAVGAGGGIFAQTGGQFTLSNAIVAGSVGGDVGSDNGVIVEAGFNIIEDGSFVTAPTSMNGDPMLEPLADNGGPTMTHALLPGSPAIDAGDCSGGTVHFDQRRISRPQGSGCDIGAFEVFVPCHIADPIPNGDSAALIAAIRCANDRPGPDTINLSTSGDYPLVSVENVTDGPNGLPSIISEITIVGNGATVRREGAQLFRVHHVASSGELNLNELTIRGGTPASIPLEQDAGGGVFNRGELNMTGVTVRNSLSRLGGGVFNEQGTLTLVDSTVTDNSTQFLGAGAGVYNSAGGVTMLRTFVTNNRTPTKFGNAGGILNRDIMVIRDSVISDNRTDESGGGIFNVTSGVLTLENSVVTRNIGVFRGGGLFNNGVIHMAGSAITENTSDTGGGIYHSNGLITVQESSVALNVSHVDAGGLFIGGKDVATLVNTSITQNTAPGRGGGILNTGALEAIECLIDWNDSQDGGGLINDGGVANLSATEIANNVATNGAGILATTGTLTVVDCLISGNATTAGGNGGGIQSDSATVEIRGSTIVGNSSTTRGGGIFNNIGTLHVTNSTLSGNLAGTRGGGIHNFDGTVSLRHTTLSENAALEIGGGVFNFRGLLELSNLVIAGSGGGDCGFDVGNFSDLGYNVVEDGTCVSHPTSMSGDPMLAPLADNGGPTMTHALLPGSPAIDAGDCAGGTVLVDQRGIARPQGAACDIGAFEAVLPVRPGVEAALIQFP